MDAAIPSATVERQKFRASFNPVMLSSCFSLRRLPAAISSNAGRIVLL
jgi:hypothetical protein